MKNKSQSIDQAYAAHLASDDTPLDREQWEAENAPRLISEQIQHGMALAFFACAYADQAHDENAPVWWPLASMVLALVGGLGLAALAVEWFSAGHPIAGFIAAAAVVGWLAGLYPSEPPDNQGR